LPIREYKVVLSVLIPLESKRNHHLSVDCFYYSILSSPYLSVNPQWSENSFLTDRSRIGKRVGARVLIPIDKTNAELAVFNVIVNVYRIKRN
jgi:hypothetical protein